MLEEVRIRNLGVIEDALLELGPGLTVLTGETGAGKTMIVTSLGLLLGGKADASAVRAGADSALVEGRVAVRVGSPAARRAEEAGAELEEGALLLARSVAAGAAGRSRAHLGGRSVPASLLAELAEDLVVVHGQSDQHRLLRSARQREVLDRYAGPEHAELLRAHGEQWAELRDVESELRELLGSRRERAQEADALRHGLDRIAAVEPLPGEDALLREEADRLGNADALRTAAATAHDALLGDPDDPAGGTDAASLAETARRALEHVADHDPALGVLAKRAAELGYLVADLGNDLASYAASVDADPARLAAVEERRAALAELSRRYGDTADDVLAWSRAAADRLAALDGGDGAVDLLRTRRSLLRERLAASAEELSRRRRAAADRLSAAVTAELAALAMPRSRLDVAVTQRPAGPDDPWLELAGDRVAAGPTGVDEVELLLSAGPGSGPRPLDRGASGGELSRVMLALEVVLAAVDPVPTFVFDEVDAGVGGKAAGEIGRRLALLARTAQVLVVTHLPQVAAYADRHLRVVKDSDGAVTRSGVVLLDEPGRVQELSRMLSGLEGSETGLAHARELLTTSRATTRAAEASPARSRRRGRVQGTARSVWHDDSQ